MELRPFCFVNSELESGLLVPVGAVSTFERAGRAEILIVDFGVRQKGLCDAFGLWNCVLRIWAQKLRRVLLVVVEMLCIALDYYLYPRLYLDIICKRDRNCIG
ncbi:uncharacterized protein DS421_13g421420 [Arachis hypogaea]|nr:uncharacterized protein DS421_13g421400 [Arachis hypogaea]QHO02156.1 uncharacterized protein DS421_13g421420 [Arachis hypogaea]